MNEQRTPARLWNRLSSRVRGRPSQPGAPTSVHAWDRWHTAFHYVLYGLLILAMVSAFFDGPVSGEPSSWGYWGAVCALTLLFGGWHWITVMRHPEWAQEQPLKVLAYFIGAIPMFVGLVYLHPSYMSLLLVLFFNLYALWPTRWAIPGAVALSLVAWWSGSGLGLAPMWSGPVALLFFGVATTVSVILSLFIDAIIGQSEERQRLIEELEATREELAAEERRAGTLEERGRLAREIHDTLAQGFISIVTHLEAAEEELSPETKSARRHLDQALRAARENLVEARRLVAALRPEILEGSSLPEALTRLAARWSEASGVPAEVNVTGDQTRLPQELQVALLRAAQEALSNARRHARANRVTMTLSYLDSLAVLDVQDDGIGFEPAPISPGDPTDGFGLRAMRERVESLGGKLLVESAPGEGATLAVQLPLETGRAAFETQRPAP